MNESIHKRAAIQLNTAERHTDGYLVSRSSCDEKSCVSFPHGNDFSSSEDERSDS